MFNKSINSFSTSIKIVPLKNLINEAYAKDISKKIDTSFENMFKQGIFLATTAAYGYKKAPDDPHMVLVDEEVKDIVIRIYVEFLTGSSLAQIAKGLNADVIRFISAKKNEPECGSNTISATLR